MKRAPDEVHALDLTGRDRQVRAAMATMSQLAANFSRAARRTLPFLAKQRGRLEPGPVSIGPQDNDSALEGPRFLVSFESEKGNAWAELVLDTQATTLVLDGALGSTSIGESQPLTQELTLAQRALMTRVARSLGQDLVRAASDEARIKLRVVLTKGLAPGEVTAKTSTEGLYVRCDFDGFPVKASITLGVSATALEEAAREIAEGQTPHFEGDPRIAEALASVPLAVVAELGKTHMNLRDVLRLETGTVLRLRTAIDDPISVRVGGLVKLGGAPVISRGQLAIEIRDRHGT